MKKSSITALSAICVCVGLAIGILGATLSYGQETGILKQKVASLEELKDVIRDIRDFHFQIINGMGELKRDVAVLTAIMERIEQDLPD
jgi:hypothetical protein